jgi:hypothetical protein
LLASVREKHPEASETDIARAAFYALTQAVDGNAGPAQRLRDVTPTEGAAGEGGTPIPVTRRRKDRRKDAQRDQHLAR